MVPRRALLLLTLPALLASSLQACRRRLENIYPGGQARNPTEQILLEITRDLESCLELGEGTREEQRARFRRALERWQAFHEEHRARPPTPELESPDYVLVMTSINGYLERVRELGDQHEWADARVQSVAVQHVFGELYGVLPGRAAPVDNFLYTLDTLRHLPLPPARPLEWRARLELMKRRLGAWLELSPPIVLGLRSLAEFRQVVEEVRGVSVPGPLPPGTEGRVPELLRRLHHLGHRIPAEAFQVAWEPEKAGELLVPGSDSPTPSAPGDATP